MQKETEHSRNLMHCESCGSEVPGYDLVNCGSIEHGYRGLCNQCFNAEVASAQGLESFENLRFDPIVMTDCAGEEHEFHFRTRLLGAVVAVDVFEVKRGQPAGYQFQIVDDSEVELVSLLGRLIEREFVAAFPSRIWCRAISGFSLLTRPHEGASSRAISGFRRPQSIRWS
jgi:hypothetical protein